MQFVTKRLALLCFLHILGSSTAFFSSFIHAQNVVTYAGGSGKERFSAVIQLSNGTLLVGGQANDLNWLPTDAKKTPLSIGGINSASTGNIGFILQLSADMSKVLNVVHFPLGSVRDVSFIKTSNDPCKPTGDVFISGNRDVTDYNQDGYYIAKLNNNFVNGVPTALAWSYNVTCKPRQASGFQGESAYKTLQPWDVGGDGKVVFGMGAEYDFAWAEIRRLNPNGQPEVVENWLAHWFDGGEWDGTPAATYPNKSTKPLVYSAIVLKAGRKGSLRSQTQAQFDALMDDGNGNKTRKGSFPDDYYFKGPCGLEAGSTCGGSGGYTGYKTSDKPTQRLGAIAVDRRTNHIYFGYSTQSVLPTGEPDFEPAVVAMDEKGKLKWWNRLYPETTKNSSPDQYVDNMAIDYASNSVVVLARCHGNNTDNLWRGNQLKASPNANGFQNQFTGTNGNIHISWLGKLTLNEGTVKHTTYVAEYIEGTTNYGTALTNPNMDAWPNPNAGWPNVNTTRLNGLHVAYDGAVSIIGAGRRTMTTRNAFQKMPLPTLSTKGAWNNFVRTYAPDLSRPLYSSILTGAWDQATGVGGDNVTLQSVFKTESGVFAVGFHKVDASNVPMGVAIPTAAIPAWGNNKPSSEQAVFARLVADSLRLTASCLPIKTSVQTFDNQAIVRAFPNPVTDNLTIETEGVEAARFAVVDLLGRTVQQNKMSVSSANFSVSTTSLQSGVYFLQLFDGKNSKVATVKFFKM